MWILLSPTLAKASLVPILSYAASRALEIPQRAARPGHLSARLRPRRRRRRDAGGGKRQHAHPLRRHRAGRRQRGLRRAVVAATDPVGAVPGAIRPGPGEPALHRRLHGPPGPQRQPLGQGDPGPGRVRRPLPDARRHTPTRRSITKLAKADAAHWMKVGRRGRPLPPGLRQAQHLEPEIQSGLGPHPRLEHLPAGSRRRRKSLTTRSVMQRYGVPLDSRTKLTKTDWSFWSATLADNQADFEALDLAHLRLPQRNHRARSAGRFLRYGQRAAAAACTPGRWSAASSSRCWPTARCGRNGPARDKMKVGNWAPLPEPPQITEVVATSRQTPAIWRYTTREARRRIGPSPSSMPPPGRKVRPASARKARRAQWCGRPGTRTTSGCGASSPCPTAR